MAKNTGVWGIDIGRSAIKALRCRLDGDSVIADGFDFIEYPKALSQSDADPTALIKEALEQFLSRNSVRGDMVAVSVSGEAGLARYFKPPPVDVKKIADIVKYEAKQQIPFALEDVIWDFQRMPGGQEVDGFALDTEIGLFAMKREQVAKALAPYGAAHIEVDYIQLAPVALYNYAAYDLIKELDAGKEYSSEDPPKSTVVLAIGTDTTDLVVTNGYRLWQRNIPLGGSHFTKQLSKDLKLTFAKAEHLKRNPKQADDPKAVFQAMRPVFGDLVTEVQRSIRHFQNLDRKAEINRVVLLGNTGKLPGLQQYLSKHLGFEVLLIESFNKMSGASVVTSPSFKDNLASFGACYGLCLQGLGKGKISTNLLPREIYTQRMIKAKKPWALAALAALVLGCTFDYVFHYRVWNEVYEGTTVNTVSWSDAIKTAETTNALSKKLIADDVASQEHLKLLTQVSNEVVGTADRRVLWLELMKALNNALPLTDEKVAPTQVPDHKALDFVKRKDLKIEYIESQYFPLIGEDPESATGGLADWWTDEVKRKYIEANPQLTATPVASDATGTAATTGTTTSTATTTTPSFDSTGTTAGPTSGIDVSQIDIPGPKGAGWVVEIRGYHFFNDPNPKTLYQTGHAHVRNTLMNYLENGTIELPLGPGMPTERFTLDELGVGYVILAWSPPIVRNYRLPNPNYVPPTMATGGSAFGEVPKVGASLPGAKVDPAAPAAEPIDFPAPRCDFIVQFVWQEKPLTLRLEERKKAAAAAKLAAEIGEPIPGVTPEPEPNAPKAPPATATPAATTPPAAPGTDAPAPATGIPPAGVPAPGSVPANTTEPNIAPAATGETPTAPPATPPFGGPVAPPAAGGAATGVPPATGAVPAAPPAAPTLPPAELP